MRENLPDRPDKKPPRRPSRMFDDFLAESGELPRSAPTPGPVEDDPLQKSLQKLFEKGTHDPAVRMQVLASLAEIQEEGSPGRLREAFEKLKATAGTEYADRAVEELAIDFDVATVLIVLSRAREQARSGDAEARRLLDALVGKCRTKRPEHYLSECVEAAAAEIGRPLDSHDGFRLAARVALHSFQRSFPAISLKLDLPLFEEAVQAAGRPPGRHRKSQRQPTKWDAIEKMVRAAGLSKHSFASRYVQAGGSLMKCAAILGHSSSEVTLRYAHLQPGNFTEHERALVDVDLQPAKVLPMPARAGAR